MSVEKVARSDGRKVWRVRWRDEHGRNRARTLGRKRDAEAFDAEIRRLRRLGELGITDAGRISLAEFGQEWLVAYAVPNLEPKTLRTYESLWDRHVLPNIGGVELRQLRPVVLDRYLAQLQRDGLSPASVKKVAGMLQGVLQRAVEWERIAQNPMRVAHKPKVRRRIVIRPIAPAQVEQLRRHLVDEGRLRCATLVSLLAYSGLRPGEALALTWDRIGERTIAVTGASSMGRLKGTKTGAERTVRLLPPLLKISPSGGSPRALPPRKASCSPATRRSAPSPRASGTDGPRARSERPSSRWDFPRPAHTTCATRSSRC
jgi:integrase